MPNQWPDRYGGLIVDSTGRFHSVVPRRLVGALVSRRRRADRASVGVRRAAARTSRPKASAASIETLVAREPGQRSRVSLRRRFLGRRHAGGLSRRVACRSAGPRAFASARSGGGLHRRPTARVIDSVLWDDVGGRGRRHARTLHRRRRRQDSLLEPASGIAPSFRETESSSSTDIGHEPG